MATGSGSGSMAVAASAMANGLVPYHLKPPSWREPWLERDEAAVSGFPQFFPTHPGQEEDTLSENVIKNGYKSRTVVPPNMEFFSAHTLMNDKLASGELQKSIKLLASRVRDGHEASIVKPGPPGFRLPSRVTLNEQKREQWVNEFADDSVPLAKLSRTIPHGYRGEKLFDMLASRQVSTERALWYIKAIGATDINASRNRTNFTIAGYTREWTKTVTDYIEGEISGRASTQTTTNKKSGKQPLRDVADLMPKLRYLLDLVDAMWREDLLDQACFLAWLSRQVASCPLFDLPLFCFMIHRRVRDATESTVLSACLAKACLVRYEELAGRPTNDDYFDCQSILAEVIDVLSETTPTLFDSYVFQGGEESSACKIRFPRLADSSAPSSFSSTTIAKEADEIELIRLLDNVRYPVDFNAAFASIFAAPKKKRKLEQTQELQLMFDWATTADRIGHYRRYVVSGLVAKLARRSDTEIALIRWLESGILVSGTRQARLLLAELIRRNVVRPSAYMQQMIARGETERATSVHLDLLASLPDFLGNKTTNQGHVLVREIESLLHDALAYATSDLGSGCDLASLFDKLSVLAGTSDGPRISRNFVQSWLVSQPSVDSVTRDHILVLYEIFTRLDDYAGLFELVQAVLVAGASPQTLNTLLDIVESEMDTLAGLDMLHEITKALYIAYEHQKRLGLSDRRLLELLVGLEQTLLLDPLSKAAVATDWNMLISSLAQSTPDAAPLTAHPAELQILRAHQLDVNLSQVATTIWYRYHVHPNWVSMVFEGVLALLSPSNTDVACRLLKEVCERTVGGLEKHLALWLDHKSSSSIKSLFSDLQVSFWFQLVVARVISPSIFVTHVLKPAWTTTLKTCINSQGDWALIRSFASLFESLACVDRQDANFLPLSIENTRLRRESERLRHRLFTDGLYASAQCLALLSISQEVASTRGMIDDAHRFERLFVSISEQEACVAAVIRLTEPFCTAFLGLSAASQSPFHTLHSKVLGALVFLLKDGKESSPAQLVSTEDWDVFLSRLTIWRLEISKMEVQANLTRFDLDQSLSSDQRAEALKALSLHFIDRVCSGEGQTFLGEQVIKCYRGPAASIFVSLAFERVASALPDLQAPGLAAKKARQTVRSIARLLGTLLFSKSVRSESPALVELFDALSYAFENKHSDTLELVQLLEIGLLSAADEDGRLISSQLNMILKSLMSLLLKRSDQLALLLRAIENCATALVQFLPDSLPRLEDVLPATFDLAEVPVPLVEQLCAVFPLQPFAMANPWEILDVALPSSKDPVNNGPVDLFHLHAKVVERLPAVTALDAPVIGVPPPPLERGVQTNFDFETPCTGLSLPARHHRRTMQGLRLPARPAPPKASLATPVKKPADDIKNKRQADIVISDDEDASQPLAKKAKQVKAKKKSK